jgi:hypothetical protein
MRIVLGSLIALSLASGAAATTLGSGARRAQAPAIAVGHHYFGDTRVSRERLRIRFRPVHAVARRGKVVAFVTRGNVGEPAPPDIRFGLHATGTGFRASMVSAIEDSGEGRITFRLRLPASAVGKVAALRITRGADNFFLAARSATIRVRIR